MSRIKNSGKTVDWETVRTISLIMPNVEDGLSYGAPALKVGGKHLFVRWREDLDAVVLRTTFEEREDLMAAGPDVYFITDHYLNYEYVLVNLKTVTREALTDMVRRSYTLALQKKKKN